jgi:S-adenosylmethionine:tRNA ribosyltransferase-isomerase
MVRPGKKLHPGDHVVFSTQPRLTAVIQDYGTDGTRIIKFDYDGIFLETLEKVGKMPLPPYISREIEANDIERYQTVYCEKEGSVAAPTAGLHFTKELLNQAVEKGIEIAYITLHVGIGTFRPVKCERVEDHNMHFEEYDIDETNAALINKAKQRSKRVICVGTTSARCLESAAEDSGRIRSGQGNTDIFIYPGYRFKAADCLITNFHLPKSTLLMLISAFYSKEKILEAYKLAIEEHYRFFSYGDAMFII